VLKSHQRVPPGEVAYIGTDGRLTGRSRTPTSGGRRSVKDAGTPVSAAYGDRRGRTGGVMYGPYSGQPCSAIGQFESAGQWCDHWHRTTPAAPHPPPPPDVAPRRRSDHSAGDRNYFYDVAGNDGGDFATEVEWDATGNDVMDRCHDDDSCVTVASEHVYEMAA